MAYTLYHDIVAGQSDLILAIKNRLVSEGWAVVGSSDGTTYSAAGDVITAPHDGRSPTPNSIFNVDAWLRLRSPLGAGGPEFLIHHRTTVGTDLWRVRYSASAGFIGGSPGPTTPPDAADEVYIIGSSSGVDDIWGGAFSQHQAVRLFTIVGDSDEDYAFYALAVAAGRPDALFLFFMDRLTDTHPGDSDPTIIGVGGGSSGLLGLFAAQSSANDWTPATNIFRSYGWQLGYDAAVEAQMHSHSIGLMPSMPSSSNDPGFMKMGTASPADDLPRVEGLWWARYIKNITTFPANTTLRQCPPWKGKSRLFRGMSLGVNIAFRTTAARTRIALPFVGASTGSLTCLWAVWDGATLPRM